MNKIESYLTFYFVFHYEKHFKGYEIRGNEERRQHLTFNSLKTWKVCNWSYLNRPEGSV